MATDDDKAINPLLRQPHENEPIYTLYGRDVFAAQALDIYANVIEQAMADGEPEATEAAVKEARERAEAFRKYHAQHSQPRRRPAGDK